MSKKRAPADGLTADERAAYELLLTDEVRDAHGIHLYPEQRLDAFDRLWPGIMRILGERLG